MEDGLGTYLRFEAKEAEAEAVWREREWFRWKYEAALAENTGWASNDSARIPADEGQAQRMLEEIYNMRSWKLIQKYRRFMDESFLGAVLRKVRDFLFRR